MNTYLVNYQFKGETVKVGTYSGKTMSEAVTDLEKAGARIISAILTSGN